MCYNYWSGMCKCLKKLGRRVYTKNNTLKNSKHEKCRKKKTEKMRRWKKKMGKVEKKIPSWTQQSNSLFPLFFISRKSNSEKRKRSRLILVKDIFLVKLVANVQLATSSWIECREYHCHICVHFQNC